MREAKAIANAPGLDDLSLEICCQLIPYPRLSIPMPVAGAAVGKQLKTIDMEAIRACLVNDPGYEDILPTMIMPCLLFEGDADAGYPKIKAAAT